MTRAANGADAGAAFSAWEVVVVASEAPSEAAAEDALSQLMAPLEEVATVSRVSPTSALLAPRALDALMLASKANTKAAAAGALEAPYRRWSTWGAEKIEASAEELSADVVELTCEAVRAALRKSSDTAGVEFEVVPVHHAAAASAAWRRASSWRSLAPDALPLRRYFGHEVGLYFSFMGHYVSWLLWPAVLAVVPYATRVYGHSTALHPVYALGVVVWAVLFVRHWQRRQAAVALEEGLLCDATALDSGDVGGMKDYFVEAVRPGFRGTTRTSPVTGEPELWFSARWRKFVLRPAAWACVAAFLAPCLALQLVSLNFQGYMVSPASAHLRVDGVAQFADPGAVFDPNSETSFLYLIPVVVHVSGVLLLGMLFKPVAARLTEFENHRTEDAHELALVQKRVVFEFVDSYFVLFFVAFYLRDMTQLRGEFASIFAVDTARRIGMEAVLPFVTHALSNAFGSGRRHAKAMAKARTEKDRAAARVRDTHGRDEYETFDDYLEMAVQFGYVAMFAAAFPLAATLSFLGNLVEVRADALKLCFVLRRPVPRRAAACKPWTGVLQFFAVSAIVVNCLLIGVTSNHQVDAYLPPALRGPAEKLLFGVGLEHALVVLAIVIAWAVPAVPQRVHDRVAALVWHRQRKLD